MHDPASPDRPSSSLTRLAGVGQRGIQFLLDYLSIAIVSGASLSLFLLVPTNDDGSVEGGPSVIAVALLVMLVSIGWTLWVWCWRPLRNDGKTYAMSALGLRIEKQSGEPLTFGTLLVRMLFLAIDAGLTPLIGWITIATSASNQRVGDMVATTIVTRTD